jgi:hypothetical protein
VAFALPASGDWPAPHISAKLLLSAMSDLDARDIHGRSTLVAAIGSESPLRPLRMVLHARASVELADDKGRTPLMVSLGLDPRLAEVLLEAGARNDAEDKIGWTVRLRAAKFADISTLHTIMDPQPKISRQWEAVVSAADDVLGLQLENGPGRSLRVIEISPEGAMERFNFEHPRDKVSPGDLIIRVNGADESLDAIWEAVTAPVDEFALVVLSGPEAERYGEDSLPGDLV